MKRYCFFLLTTLAIFSSCHSGDMAEYGVFKLQYRDSGLSLLQNGDTVFANLTAKYEINGTAVSTTDYTAHSFSQSTVNDAFGRGVKFCVSYKAENKPALRHSFRIYDRFVLAGLTLEADEELHVGSMSPIVADCNIEENSRAVFVPFDNDAWVRYASVQTSQTATDTLRSYEVTALYNPESRNGLVVGAIEHDNWKNAVDLKNGFRQMTVTSGVADKLTRDVLKHGIVRGKTVDAATVFIGTFDDWREGMEAFADANAVQTPPRAWDKAMPVGWNSWGALAFGVNHQNSTEVVKFMADSLMTNSFHNSDGQLYTGLDSGWNSFKDEDLGDFADQCVATNQVPCIYWTPFTDWGKNPEKYLPGSDKYQYKDVYLYANGKPQEFDGAYAIDPTHPGIREMMEKTADLFRRHGYKYVKMDFMTHGRMEADSFYNKNITTGTQAYNYGMHLLDSIFHDMYMNLSISPIFPAQYAQSRRIACDAWNKIKDTEYTMNALSWGWWIDRIYQFNDADHVVLREATEGENRARITSSVITGLYILGDDFSVNGNAEAKSRAMKLITNADINRIATGRSFRPLDGNDDRSECRFVRYEDNGDIYLAVFNYTEEDKSEALPMQRMGIENAADYKVTELWTHEELSDNNAPVTIPSKDARIFLLQCRM